ncbi:DNA-processing protein DprA [Desulfobacterales bacterium HSG2]|nr:DNA-processing protein DprA [Desulfobacterales bacterium HSG2]
MTEKILPWFVLKSVPGIGNHYFKRLFDRFRSPKRVFEASYDELLEVDGISHRLAAAIQQHKIPDQVRKEIDLAARKGYEIVTMADSVYPPLLLQTPDPPPFLYVYGNFGNSAKSIAVVGSRNATRYGISTTIRLCSDLASLNIVVVSGMARGVDTAAHDGAIMARGKTIAVLGSGLERIYPAENRKLFHEIAENGAVVSEFHLTAPPEAHHFPIRNRIISGISLGTVVVEASRKSGALITARFAAEQGREVFAIPGNIHSFKSIGTHNLIKQGAKLIVNVQDIIDELPHVIRSRMADSDMDQSKILEKLPPLSSEESLVLKALGPYPVHIDDLGRKLSMDPGKLSSILLQLELKGVVQQDPGKLFSIDVKDMF